MNPINTQNIIAKIKKEVSSYCKKHKIPIVFGQNLNSTKEILWIIPAKEKELNIFLKTEWQLIVDFIRNDLLLYETQQELTLVDNVPNDYQSISCIGVVYEEALRLPDYVNALELQKQEITLLTDLSKALMTTKTALDKIPQDKKPIKDGTIHFLIENVRKRIIKNFNKDFRDHLKFIVKWDVDNSYHTFKRRMMEATKAFENILR